MAKKKTKQKENIPMAEEITLAVEWWSNELQNNTKQDAGDSEVNLFMKVFATRKEYLTQEQIEVFEKELGSLLVSRCQENWREDNPSWCSYHRAFGVDYHPDKILQDALKKAGINPENTRLPIKTVMWINPGQVSVRKGYGVEIEDIFLKESK